MSLQRVSSNGWKFDVFLSFRGEDTRRNFTGHLYTALTRKGLHVFRDDKEMERGTPVSPELVRKAIEKSRISIVVFSRSYASSSWCLDELVKIVECKSTLGQMVIPVFYDVDPSMEREQRGNFEEALTKKEEALRDSIETWRWRKALIEVINLPGLELKNRYESELIEDVVKEVRRKLNVSGSRLMNLKKILVGVSSCLEQLWMQAEIARPRVQWRQSAIAPTLIPFFFKLL